MSDVLDKQVDELFSKVSQQKKELAALKADIDKKWITTCTFNNMNVQTASREVIMSMVQQLVTLDMVYERMAKLEFGSPERKYNGFSFEDWFSDLSKRLKVIEAREKETKLNAIEEKLNTLVSPEKRREMELAELAKSLD